MSHSHDWMMESIGQWFWLLIWALNPPHSSFSTTAPTDLWIWQRERQKVLTSKTSSVFMRPYVMQKLRTKSSKTSLCFRTSGCSTFLFPFPDNIITPTLSKGWSCISSYPTRQSSGLQQVQFVNSCHSFFGTCYKVQCILTKCSQQSHHGRHFICQTYYCKHGSYMSLAHYREKKRASAGIGVWLQDLLTQHPLLTQNPLQLPPPHMCTHCHCNHPLHACTYASDKSIENIR